MGRGKRGAGGSAALRAGRGWGGGDPGSLPVSGGRGSGGPRAPGEVGWGGGPGRLGGPQRGSEGEAEEGGGPRQPRQPGWSTSPASGRGRMRPPQSRDRV